MTPLQVWTFAQRWLWLFLLGALLAAVGSYVVSIQLPKVYEARALLLVTPSNPSANGAVDYSGLQAAQNLTTTYAELVKTRPVIETALQAGGLDLGYDQVAGSADAGPVRNTQLLQLTVRSSDPDQAAKLANLLASALIQQAQASQSSRFSATKDGLGKQLDQLAGDIAQHTQQIAALQAQSPNVERDAQLARSQFELAQFQQTYVTTQQSYESVRLTEARTIDLLSVADPATPSGIPVQPQVQRSVLVAALVGLLIAVGVAFLVESLDDRVRSPQTLARFTDLPALGTVSIRPKDAPATVDQFPRDVVPRPGSSRYDDLRAAEPYRLLSANLQFATAGHALRALMITSCGAQEGKTTTAANLAIVLAQAGKEVILVDADLYAPALHRQFGIQNDAGLTSVLLEGYPASPGLLLQTRVDGLRLLPTGPIPPNPGELLASQRMRDELARMRTLADVVIIDSPPVLEVGDLAVLACAVDGVLLVVDAQRTRGPHAARALATLHNAGALVLGVVLNRVSGDPHSYYSADDYAPSHDVRPDPK